MKKLITVLKWLTIFSWYTVIIVIIFWLNYPYRIYETQSIRNITPIVKAGGIYTYEVSGCKYSDVPLEVSKFLVNGTFLPYTPYTAQTFTGCTTKKVNIEIPSYTELGTYHIRIVVTRRVNPMRIWTYTYDTPNFQIVK